MRVDSVICAQSVFLCADETLYADCYVLSDTVAFPLTHKDNEPGRPSHTKTTSQADPHTQRQRARQTLTHKDNEPGLSPHTQRQQARGACPLTHKDNKPDSARRAFPMGCLRLVGSLKIEVFFAQEPCKGDHILQKRPII